MNKLGNIKTISDPKVLMQNRTGVKRIHTPEVNLTVGALDASVAIDFDIVFGGDAAANLMRPGMGIEVKGLDTTPLPVTVALIIGTNVAGNVYNCRTVSVTKGGAIPATTATTFVALKYDIHITSVENYKGAAPAGFSVTPDFTENWVQFMRFSYEADPITEGSNKIFEGLKKNSSIEAESLLYGSIEYELLCSHETLRPINSGTSIGGTTRGLPFYGGKLGGIPMLLGTKDLSESECQSYTVEIAALDATVASQLSAAE
jgi:hypothetical protein